MATHSLLLVLALLPLLAAADGPRPVVRTQLGAVRGTSRQAPSGRHFSAFYNLPYAKPPVGALRFKDPQPPESWSHVRDASTKGPSCTQYPLLGMIPPWPITEDCLYLNVFTPQLKPSELLPVMVWIHGGALMAGGGSWYEPDFLMERDVVLVTINYRLGPLGFLSTGGAEAPGNWGLKDQVAALRWVRDHVEAFGGDPGCVTVFGTSAGGSSVHYLLLSPLAKGLFHRAISQSGSAFSPWAVAVPGAEVAERARRAAKHLGCPAEPPAALLDCLRGVDEFELTSTQALFAKWAFHLMVPYRPVVESERESSFLPKHPADLRPHTAIPWLVGVNKDEGLFVTKLFAANKTMKEELEQNIEKLFPISLLYDTSPQANLITKKILEFYFPSGELVNSKLTEVYSDGLFTWNVDEAVRKYKDTAPVYYYLFSYRGKYQISSQFGDLDEVVGVSHLDELSYLFSNTSLYNTPADIPERDMEVVRRVIKLWTDFAKTGNPTPQDEPLHWPNVRSNEELEYLEIGQELQVKKGLYDERLKFWRSLPIRDAKLQNSIKNEL